MKKRRCLGVLVFLLLFLCALPLTAAAAESSFASAKKTALGKNVSSSLTEAYPERWFSFTLPVSGRTILYASSLAEHTSYRLYDPSGSLVFRRDNVRKNESTGKSRIDEVIDLKGGTYYLCVDSKYLLISRSYGKFVFRVNYTAVKETFAETNRSENIGLKNAPAVSFGTAVRGQIAVNEEQDVFRFRVPKDGIVTLSAKAEMRYLWYIVYDANGSQLYSRHAVWDAKSKASFFTADLALRAGTYYLSAAKDRSTGPYAFRLSYKKTAVTFPETAEKQNDSTDTASRIDTGKTIQGLIALNNEKDYYTFTVSKAGSVRVQAAAYTKYIAYTILNSRGETVWSSTPRRGASSGKSRIDETASLARGTYYFFVRRVGDNTGRYLFRLS